MVSGIILAGGSSTRYGTGENKTLVELLGRPVLEYSLRVFLAADVVDEVVLAAKAGEEAALRKLAEGLCLQKPVTVVTGGADRAASVENALAAARGEVVLIQDGARPLVTERMLEDCLAALEEAGKLGEVNAIHLGDLSCISMDYMDRFTVKLDYDADFAYELQLLEMSIASDKIQDNMTGTFDMRQREDGSIHFRQNVRG